MPTTVQNNFRIRKTYAKIQKIIDIPNLIHIQNVVLTSIKLYDETDFKANEVDDIRPNLVLPAKAAIKHLPAANMSPQFLFRIGHARSKPACEFLLGAFSHEMPPSQPVRPLA